MYILATAFILGIIAALAPKLFVLGIIAAATLCYFTRSDSVAKLPAPAATPMLTWKEVSRD